MNLKESAATYRPVFDQMMKQYPKMPALRFAAEAKRLMQISGNARYLIGKRMLDLGCGSKENLDQRDWLTRLWNKWFDYGEFTRFEPWYCRVAHAAGAKVTGIDIAPNGTEQFESMQLNLMEPEVLTCIPDKSFDGANNMCLTVPDDSKRARMGTSPAIMYKLGMNFEAASEINDNIFRQVERILKEGGTYTLSEFVFRKKKGQLKKEHTMDGLGS